MGDEGIFRVRRVFFLEFGLSIESHCWRRRMQRISGGGGAVNLLAIVDGIVDTPENVSKLVRSKNGLSIGSKCEGSRLFRELPIDVNGCMPQKRTN